MDFINFDKEELSIIKSIRSSYEVKYKNDTFSFWTPKLLIPFGYEEKYNSYFINLELYDIKQNVYTKSFLDFLISIENIITHKLEIKVEDLNSQLRINCQHNPIIYTKVIDKNKKIITSIRSDTNENINLFNIEKNRYSKLKLILDKIWYKNNRFYYKYKIKDMIYFNA